MKAALCKSLDGPQSLVVETMPEPSAGPGQAIVRVKAVGLNFADTLITRGKYQWKPDRRSLLVLRLPVSSSPFRASARNYRAAKASWPTSTGVARARKSLSMPVRSFQSRLPSR